MQRREREGTDEKDKAMKRQEGREGKRRYEERLERKGKKERDGKRWKGR